MELFIQIRDGQPFEHPIFGDNFREAFPEVDVDNLPPEFARFERIEQNVQPTTFEVAESTYTWVDGVVKDVWTIRPMTAEEETQKRQDLVDGANATVEYMKSIAQQNADNAPSDAAKQAWLSYLAELNAWTLIDPVSPNIPKPPLIRPDGTVMSINASGSEPNVIG
jgi:hypothetical protein